jgi:hypothetical protein
MGSLTHKRNNNRKTLTRRVQRGGRSDAKKAASALAFSKGLTPAGLAAKEAEIDKMPDTGLGILISEKSLNSQDQKIRGTPYVIIVPQADGTTKHAYGSTADNAVKAAINKQWSEPRFSQDTYTGTMISKKALISTNPKYTKEPYMISIPSKTGGVRDVDRWYGSTPANTVAKAAQTNASAVIGRMGSSFKSAVGRFSTKKAPATPAAAPSAAPAAPPPR